MPIKNAAGVLAGARLQEIREKDARIAELEDIRGEYDRHVRHCRDKLTEERLVNQGNLAAANGFRDRAEKAEKELMRFEKKAWSLLNRAEAAEARVKELEKARDKWITTYSKGMAEERARVREATERAEKAEADRDWNLSVSRSHRDAVKKAEAHVKELEAENARLWDNLAARDSELDDTPETFTAPDGHVSRVGQRVWVPVEASYGTIRGFIGDSGLVWVDMPDERLVLGAEDLRRVYDGSEEPDVPVGTVLRDKDGDRIVKLGNGWLIENKSLEWRCPWNWPDTESGPYVEVLDGD